MTARRVIRAECDRVSWLRVIQEFTPDDRADDRGSTGITQILAVNEVER